MNIIDGKKISDAKRAEIKERVSKITKETGKVPGLATILVGENPASQVYINSKIKACENAGIKSFHRTLPANSSKEEIISLIKNLNADSQIDGILLQLPLPDNSFAQDCINAISPLKDVDGLHPFNAGLLNLSKNWQELIDKNVLLSCTPSGVIHLLHASKIEIAGKTAVVIGRSNLVGKPLSMMLLANDATVIMAHSKTKNLKEVCKNADIVVAAIGKAKFVTKEFIKDGATVIDVGINRVDGKLYGDVDFESLTNANVFVTPVPGGVGPMTITMLLENTLKAFNNRK
ncbi:bifunctional methylenetetrahydrofolate dehydrogenase/methenyltetrahydrofolate cyclohydrolase FolD [Endomicrobium proavitum]|uniref:Bifunctional protein FolD n=1 Tax=Endomicrobium proavitum TaxID=1408281 RepID=A0A0G3WIQ9_9BACT|nr:bifunctional methylenetetrahydrofolate dehydrogenase/methenyltetrahydrofolate cyclohydrolase FolD [Endomicrobium proavitum]AKL98526.1 Methylenetetrahydrofolate dehydrogenase [Endomicrobium proavitum]